MLKQHLNIKKKINQNLIEEFEFNQKYENEVKLLKSKIKNYKYAKKSDLFSITHKRRNIQLQNKINSTIRQINKHELIINSYYNKIEIYTNKITFFKKLIYNAKLKHIIIKFLKNSIINVNIKKQSLLNLKKNNNNQKIMEMEKDLANMKSQFEKEEKNLIAKLIEENAKTISDNKLEIDEIRKKINLKQINQTERQNMEFNLNILKEENNFLIEEESNNIQNIITKSKKKQEEHNQIFAKKTNNINFQNLLLDIKINGIQSNIKREKKNIFKFAKYLNSLAYKLFLEKQNLIKYLEQVSISKKEIEQKFSNLNNIRNEFIYEIDKDQTLYNYLDKNYNFSINHIHKQIKDLQLKIKMQNNLQDKIIKIIKSNPKLHLLILKNK